jgi:hypothetical protein
VITGGIEGSHSRASLHYTGDALDIRSKDLSGTEKIEALTLAKSLLGDDFDLILEADGLLNEHFHLEFQPKTKYGP